MELPVGTIVVTQDNLIGRVQKILTENLRVVHVYNVAQERFRMSEIQVRLLRIATDKECLELKRHSIRHNKKLQAEIARTKCLH